MPENAIKKTDIAAFLNFVDDMQNDIPDEVDQLVIALRRELRRSFRDGISKKRKKPIGYVIVSKPTYLEWSKFISKFVMV